MKLACAQTWLSPHWQLVLWQPSCDYVFRLGRFELELSTQRCVEERPPERRASAASEVCQGPTENEGPDNWNVARPWQAVESTQAADRPPSRTCAGQWTPADRAFLPRAGELAALLVDCDAKLEPLPRSRTSGSLDPLDLPCEDQRSLRPWALPLRDAHRSSSFAASCSAAEWAVHGIFGSHGIDGHQYLDLLPCLCLYRLVPVSVCQHGSMEEWARDLQ